MRDWGSGILRFPAVVKASKRHNKCWCEELKVFKIPRSDKIFFFFYRIENTPCLEIVIYQRGQKYSQDKDVQPAPVQMENGHRWLCSGLRQWRIFAGRPPPQQHFRQYTWVRKAASAGPAEAWLMWAGVWVSEGVLAPEPVTAFTITRPEFPTGFCLV